jgi:hypothetical protein
LFVECPKEKERNVEGMKGDDGIKTLEPDSPGFP